MKAIAVALCYTLVCTHALHAAETSEPLNKIATAAVKSVQDEFPSYKIADNDIAVTIIDLRDPAHITSGNFRGDEAFYPASVVKLFYIVATQQWLQDGKLKDSEELRRGMRDMIIDSNNDATNYIVDCISGVGSGPEVPEDQLKQFTDARSQIDKYFQGSGFSGIHVGMKTWCQGPYGRERQILGPKFENRNQLTTSATANLLSEIVQGKAVNPDRSKQIMELLHRNMKSKSSGGDDQAHSFSAGALSADDDQLWSKAGWTNTWRHDAAYIETKDGLKVVIVTFTANHGNQRPIIPAVVKNVLKNLRTPSAQAEAK